MRQNINQNIEAIRHSLSHILAIALVKTYKNVKLGIGPTIENGFYYDFDLESSIKPEDLPKLEQKMRDLIKKGLGFERQEKSIVQARAYYKTKNQPYKLELINDLARQGYKKVSFYKTGDFVDLCRGGHVTNTRELNPKAFKLNRVAGAYWRGSQNNPQLQRVYGLAFETRTQLENHLKSIEKAKQSDHKILGPKLGLIEFASIDTASLAGSIYWLENGAKLYNLIKDYLQRRVRRPSYQEVMTPAIYSIDLFKRSGHWDNYRDLMFILQGGQHALKPMNCPPAVLIFKSKLRSYRDLPIRLAEFGTVYRNEKEGVINGLLRTRAFTQDDAHIFCLEDQIASEVKELIKLLDSIYSDFGFDNLKFELSTRPKKSIGSSALWSKAERALTLCLKTSGLEYQENPGEGAFYGPKIDVHVQDALGRSWQMGTIQLDFAMAKRLGANYIDSTGSKQTPIIIHRAILGSIERFIAILLEHYSGSLPVWLAPEQIRLIPVSDQYNDFARSVRDDLAKQGVRVGLDDSSQSVGKKIRQSELDKVPYTLVLGQKERSSKFFPVRRYNSATIKPINRGQLIKLFQTNNSPNKEKQLG